jgi:hypothetical protein
MRLTDVGIGVLLASLSMATGCGRDKEPDASPVRGTVPRDLQEIAAHGLAVEGERVQFDGDLTVPPTLKGFPAVSTVRLEIVPGQHPPAEETRQRMRAMAVQNPRIKEALGKRFALLGSGWLDVEKGKDETPAADRYQLVFYNYDKNQVVTVIASGRDEVLDLRASAPSVQPPESREEVEATVSDYFDMLAKELRGEDFNKAEHNRNALTSSLGEEPS